MKRNIVISILCFVAIILCCLSAVSAENIDDVNSVISTIDDVDTDTELSASDDEVLADTPGSFTELQNLITPLSNNGHLYLDKDYIYTDGDSPIVLDKIVNIHGNGKTIDGANKVTIFTTSKRIILDNITFKNGNGENGGALSLLSNPKASKITNCIFLDNTASKEGGAIYCTQQKPTISNCEFRNNHAETAGAIKLIDNAKDSKSDSIISYCDFYYNSAEKAGAVDVIGRYSKIIMTNCSFYNNNATEAGAVYARSEKLQILNSSFKSNSAVARGGAIFVGIKGVTISACEFYENEVTEKVVGSPTNRGGGAIYYSVSSNLTNSKFEGNKALLSYGGAIFVDGNKTSNLDIVGCEFIKNSGNTNPNDNNGIMGGGAIHFNGVKCTISNSNFTDNNAVSGSAIYLRTGTLDISDSSFFKNLANASTLVISGANDVVVNENREVNITAHLYGRDNVINAIWNKKDADMISFKNVDYYGVNGEMNTGNAKVTCVDGYANSNDGAIPYKDGLVSQFNVLLEIYKGNDLIYSVTYLTDIKGEVKALNIKLNPGKYVLKAKHEKDDYYGFIESQRTFEVPKYQTKVVETNVSDKAFRSIDITVDILDENNNKVQNGTAKMSFNNEVYESPVVGGKATFTGVKLPKPGNYSTTVYYKDVENYYVDSNGKLNIEVLKLDTTTSIELISGVTGDTVNVVVNVVDEDGNPVKSGSVELTYDSQNADVNDGKATFSVTLQKPGNYDAQAKYSGDTTYNPSNDDTQVVISKINTTVVETNVSDKAFRSIDITVDILDDNNNKVQNGTAKMSFNNKEYESPVVGGKATFTGVKLPKPGNYSTTVYYKDVDGYYVNSNGTLNIEVLKLDTTTSIELISGVTGDTVDVVVNVVDEDENPVKSGSVELIIYYDSNSPLGSSQSIILKASNDSQNADVSDGKATFSVTLQKPGNYTTQAKYSGDTTYNPSSAENEARISKINTTTNEKDGAKVIDSIKESAGTVKDITVDILTNDGTPVKNGTAIMVINGKSYTADVVDGKATFKDVVMPDKDTVAEIYYQGNDWYNPSNSTFNITIEQEDDQKQDQDSDDSSSDDDAGSDSDDGVDEDIKSDSESGSKSVNGNLSSNATGYPIFAILLVLFTLVCNSIRREE